MTESYILFVEDSRMCMMETSELLRDHGFNVLEAHCAQEAFEALQGAEFLTALVTDIDLGEGPDGFEVARRARIIHPGLPVVYVSGSACARHLTEGVRDSEFISKPYRRQRVVEALKRVMQLKAA
ncbi:MAG: response regulator receiver protein [Caulobacter sp.]|nr:response regulator receiver protein [Caulobacter sp.]